MTSLHLSHEQARRLSDELTSLLDATRERKYEKKVPVVWGLEVRFGHNMTKKVTHEGVLEIHPIVAPIVIEVKDED